MRLQKKLFLATMVLLLAVPIVGYLFRLKWACRLNFLLRKYISDIMLVLGTILVSKIIWTKGIGSLFVTKPRITLTGLISSLDTN